MYPTVVKFPVSGVHVVEQTYSCTVDTCTVALEQLEAQTKGAYRCEISGDAPEFKLASRTANMTISG